jgi:hypothetical protein
MVDHGLRTRNEVRGLDNMPPATGGDDLTVNAALVPLKMLSAITKARATAPTQPPGFRPTQGASESGGTVVPPGTPKAPVVKVDAKT